ncbi:MAG: apolipoprotein N-acyltransferase [Porticoccus sp.]|nr:apolipoprotein N-acyltransferase [Porticoccus sp.]
MNFLASKMDIKTCLLSVLFGLLLPLSMAPFNIWPAGVLSIAGFAALICGHTTHQSSAKFVFLHSLSYGLGVYAVGASWIFVSIHDYGQAGIALSLLLITPFIIFLSFLLTIPFVVFSKLRSTITADTHNYTSYSLAITMLLIFPSLWTISEWFRGWAFSGFPWLYLGYGHTDTWLSGWAPVTGVLGISWITAFCGAWLGLAFKLCLRVKVMNTVKKNIALPLSSGLIIAALFWLTGAYLQTIAWTQPTGHPLSIGLVQPALPLSLKWDPHQLPTIFAQYRADTEKLLHNDLVIWPESAIPRFQHEVTGYLEPIAAEANETNTALITGIPTAENLEKDDTSNPNSFYSRYYNSVIGLGQASGVYHKQHLVPFGEYVPFEKWLRGTIAFFDLPMSAFNPGPEGQQHITAKGAIIATAICYEIAYSELVRKSANGANLLLTLSNDTWFGQSIGPKQHFQIARMRAIENRKPLIRATNDGISALITAEGQIASIIPPFQRNTLEGTLEPRNGLTPFGRFGSDPILVLSFLLALIGLLQTYRSKNIPV